MKYNSNVPKFTFAIRLVKSPYMGAFGVQNMNLESDFKFGVPPLSLKKIKVL